MHARIDCLVAYHQWCSIGALLIVLLFPDALNEVVLSTVFPLVGTVLGVPLDAGFDWVAFALAAVSLLRFFPAHLVAEHYRRIFRDVVFHRVWSLFFFW